MRKFVCIFITILVLSIVAAIFLFKPSADIDNSDNVVAPLTVQQNAPADSVKITGLVLDGITNRPLPAQMTIRQSNRIVTTAECDESGVFSLPLEDGRYELTAEYPGYVAKGKNDISKMIEIDGKNVDFGTISLLPAAQIKGHIIEGNQDLRADIAFFYQHDNSGERYYKYNTISTDESGNFLLKQAYGGIQDIEITADGFVSQKLTGIEIHPGQTIDLGDIPMIMGVTVFGTVTDASTKRAIADAKIQYTDFQRKLLVDTKSAKDGSFALPATAMNKFYVTVAADGYNSAKSYIASNMQHRYELNVALSAIPSAPSLTAQEDSKPDTPLPIDPTLEHNDHAEADATAKKLFMENEKAYQDAIAIKLNDAPEDADISAYLQAQLIQKAGALQIASEKYSQIIVDSHSPEWSTASFVRLGALFYDVADQLMLSNVPPDLPEDVEKAYLGVLHNFAGQFMNKAVDYYEKAVEHGSTHHISNEYIQEAEKQLSLMRY